MNQCLTEKDRKSEEEDNVTRPTVTFSLRQLTTIVVFFFFLFSSFFLLLFVFQIIVPISFFGLVYLPCEVQAMIFVGKFCSLKKKKTKVG